MGVYAPRGAHFYIERLHCLRIAGIFHRWLRGMKESKMTVAEGIGVANDVTTGVGCRSFVTMKKSLQKGVLEGF